MSWNPQFPSRTVAALAIAQSVKNSGAVIIVATAPLVGMRLASNEVMATIPLTVLPLVAAACVAPVAWLMQRIGRKQSFMLSTTLGVAGALLAWQAIVLEKFWLFVAAVALIAGFNAVGNYFRFAAADSVPESERGRAVSVVLIGGVIAAFIGPNLAKLSRDAIDHAPFAGSYLAMIPLYGVALVALSLTRLGTEPSELEPIAEAVAEPVQEPVAVARRTLRTIMRQPRYIVAVVCATLGYAAMSLVMTATPLAMKHHAHEFGDTAFVIQWHVLGMFAPSFFTGGLIRRFGVFKILAVGATLGMGCVAANLAGTTVWHFWLGLLLLGLSWNFMFIGGTTLLTTTYQANERNKAQAGNDFVVFAVVAASALSAGALHHTFGWRTVNLAALPMYLAALLTIVWCLRVAKD